MFKSNAQTLVNTVNCVGIMGKGIALEFKNRFPEMFEDYRRRCDAGQVKLGKPYLFKRPSPPWILNFPTKDHWRSVSKIEDIVHALEYLKAHYKEWGITALAVPPLGCGQGQLEWRVVGPALYRHLMELDIPVELYAPHGTPPEQLELSFFQKAAKPGEAPKVPASRIDPAWVALVDVLDRLEKEPYHRPVGRTTFQEIAYFATEVGLPTKLRYVKGSFGPYASDLKPQITRLVNNGLIREKRLGNMFAISVGPTFADARQAYRRQIGEWDPLLERLADLFMRVRTDQAEIAATVHFASKAVEEKSRTEPSECDILHEVMQWKQRRRPPPKETEVALAIRNLSMRGWLRPKACDDLPLNDEALLDV
jgi:O-acetyl-ADP-ribose deacetylase (regulator of RNase III)